MSDTSANSAIEIIREGFRQRHGEDSKAAGGPVPSGSINHDNFSEMKLRELRSHPAFSQVGEKQFRRLAVAALSGGRARFEKEWEKIYGPENSPDSSTPAPSGNPK